MAPGAKFRSEVSSLIPRRPRGKESLSSSPASGTWILLRLCQRQGLHTHPCEVIIKQRFTTETLFYRIWDLAKKLRAQNTAKKKS